MNEKAEHTQLPWHPHKTMGRSSPMRVNAGKEDSFLSMDTCIASGDKTIGSIDFYSGTGHGFPTVNSRKEYLANVALVFKAVNCHYKLLEALETVRDELKNGNPGFRDTVWVTGSVGQTLLDCCEAAIAEAKGK